MGLPLEDVVALVVSRPLGPVDTKQVLTQKLEKLGARVAARLGKEITHIIFQRQRGSDKQEQDLEDIELRSLHDRAAKMDFPIIFVSPLWIERCLFENKRVLERKFTIPKPASNLFTYGSTPGSGQGLRKPQRRKSVQPKAPSEYTVDTADFNFSSSQQMRADQPTDAGLPQTAKLAIEAQANHEQTPEGWEDEGCGLGTQLAAEMLTGLVDEVPTTSVQQAQEMLVAMKIGHQQSGQSASKATGKRAQSATTAKQAAGVKRRRALSTGSLQAVQKRPRAPSRLKQRNVATPELSDHGTLQPRNQRRRVSQTGVKTDVPMGQSAGLEAYSLPASRPSEPSLGDLAGPAMVDEIVSTTDAPKALKPQEDVTACAGVARTKPAAARCGPARALREVDSRLEQQLPLLRQALMPLQQTPPDEFRCDIPVRSVRPVDSPWNPSNASSVAATPMPAPPAVWSQQRPWDPQKPTAPSQHLQGSACQGGLDRDSRAEAHAQHCAALPAPAVGPSQGCLAMTSVDPAIVELGKGAVKRLRGLRLCPPGVEHHITHLVIEKERRTLKVLLAITNGAWLVTPAWLTASLEAGCWLPEAPFEFKVRFSAAARRARLSLVQHREATLLKGKQVYLHAVETKKGTPNNLPVLKRLALALGAKVVSRSNASGVDICILVGDCLRAPPRMPSSCQILREEWLLQTVENYCLPLNVAAFGPT